MADQEIAALQSRLMYHGKYLQGLAAGLDNTEVDAAAEDIFKAVAALDRLLTGRTQGET